ncbi:hypothetical protein M0804_006401 [Polistes exclamans]|nr:hypothetical protein M0804_006401 [Polistes exclamans]
MEESRNFEAPIPRMRFLLRMVKVSLISLVKVIVVVVAAAAATVVVVVVEVVVVGNSSPEAVSPIQFELDGAGAIATATAAAAAAATAAITASCCYCCCCCYQSSRTHFQHFTNFALQCFSSRGDSIRPRFG